MDRRLINALQGDFPLVECPYAEVGARLGLSEAEVLSRLQGLLDDRVLTRFGPMFQIERMGGAFCLAAIAVPEADWGRAVEAVNAFPEVAHNYRREHALNMWFVLATETPLGIGEVARRIEAATGLEVCLFPKEREYFVEMKLEA
ncbi:MAG: Lrp/AsnC family transcriptional regulator [Betaproteobacteria bacterium]|nr:MAG: Lrp/AsnC family transcriptional regulator [Betaproteobacteria bacterium]